MTTETGPGGRPVWLWVLVAACGAVGVGLAIAIAGLFAQPSPTPPAPPPPATASAGASPAPSSAPPSPLGAYRLSDPLPLAAPPVWHAEPGAQFRLTAAPGELRYVAGNGCTVVLRTVPYPPVVPTPTTTARTTADASPGASAPTVPSPVSTAASPRPTPTTDQETAASLAALDGAIAELRSRSEAVRASGEDFTVVSTLGSLSGPYVDMAGRPLVVTHADGTVSHGRLAARAVPGAHASMLLVSLCPSAEEATTAMNHLSVHAYIAAG